MGLHLNGNGYKKVEIEDRRFDVMNSGKSQLTVEDATAILLWAVDGDKIKAMLHGEINEQVFCAMLRTFGKDFPDMLWRAVELYVAWCFSQSGDAAIEKAAIEFGRADRIANLPSLKEGDGERKQ